MSFVVATLMLNKQPKRFESVNTGYFCLIPEGISNTEGGRGDQ